MHTDPITRHHVDVHGRNVHLRRRGDGPPVLLLHASPRSSAALLPLIEAAPAGVTVLALDTPGCGGSAPLDPAGAEAGDHARALADTLDVLGIRRAAVYGTHTGAAIALAFAARHPTRVASLVLDGLSLFDAAEQRALLGAYLPSYTPEADGSHLARLWSRVRDQHLFFPWNDISTRTRLWQPLPEPQQLHFAALDLLRAGDAYIGPYRAAIRYGPARDLAGLPVPTLIGTRPNDVLAPHLARLPALPPNVRTEPFAASRDAWAEQVWRALASALSSTDSAAPAADTLPAGPVGSAIVGAAGARIHLRGAVGGAGRPRLWLHDSPGSARLLDHRLARAVGERPTFAVDLPWHGDSDAPSTGVVDAARTAEVLDAALRACGLDGADVEGAHAGSVVAAALARLDPVRWVAAPAMPPGPDATAVPSMPPRADGGHLFAAWLHARDTAILGPTWLADRTRRHDVGAGLDLGAVHGLCLAALLEAPEAAVLRRSLLRLGR